MREALSGTELPEAIVRHLAAQARPALLLTSKAVNEAEIALGASKLGGAPDLPRGTSWPERPAYPDGQKRAEEHRQEAERLLAESRKPKSWMTQEQGESFSRESVARASAVERAFPLAFFGQFDLAELSRHEGFDPALPAQGRLLVFYDFWEQPEDFTPEASVGWRVIWDETPPEGLERLPLPEDLAAISSEDWTSAFRAASLSATTVVTPIAPDDEDWDAFDVDEDELLETYQDWLAELGTPDMEDGENHQLGGYPRTIQNGLQASSQLAANGIYCGDSDAWKSPEAQEALEGAAEWRLLLQIGVDSNAGFDGPGAYYVIIRNEDLAARRFEQARVTYQCD